MISSEKLNGCLEGFRLYRRSVCTAFMFVIFMSYSITPAQSAELKRLASNLQLPWAIEFISEEQILITERAGKFKLFNLTTGSTKSLRSNVEVWFDGQGGLLDVALSGSYQNYRAGDWVYATYSKPDDDGASTALARFKIDAQAIKSWEPLFVSNAISDGGRHFGSRIAFDDVGHVYISSGDRGERDWAQDLASHAGKIIRLNMDGSVPVDNPFLNVSGALPEIWSYGHRNPQGLFYDEQTGLLWSIEHGPRGGDEINLIEKGKNYGWPVISYGKEYWAPIAVGEGTHREGMEQPLKYYDPSIAPGSLIVYRSKALPELDGSLLAGALKLQHINQVKLNGPAGLGREERLFGDLSERIRDLTQGPQGALYFVTDQGNLYRFR